MKSIIAANDSITSNSKQLEVLKSHFPNCFDKHGAFIPAKLQEIVEASGVALSKEGYSLNWLGKSYARLLANENVRTLLKANLEHNNLPENANSQNMLIKGDNLEVLKHLMGAYSNKVKMIYIDPPYNTGSDGFVYQDDRKFTVEQLSHLAGIDEDEAKRILEFTDSGSNSHSAWLTFMYPRLYLAKQLLRDDGVIFISIDDNEQAQLKVLCDEVFGEENFKNSIAVRRGIKNVQAQFEDISSLSSGHEYILVYAKRSTTRLPKLTFSHGIAKPGKWDTFWRGTDRPTMRFELFGETPKKGQWRWEEQRTREAVANYKHYLTFISEDLSLDEWYLDNLTASNSKFNFVRKNDDGSVQYYVPPSDGKLLSDNWMDVLLSGNETEFFDTEKSVTLLERIVGWLSLQSENDLILDFFAGSGTTAHAVMQLNAEDGGNRQFICVQLDEATDPKSEAFKAGYKSIYDITTERIKRAAVKIKAAHPDAQCDFGFKQFETIPVFEGYLDEPDELTPELELFNASKLSAQERHSLMLTWQAQDGIALTTPLTPLDLAGYTAYQGGRLVYFIEPDLTLDAIVALLERLDNLDDEQAFMANQLVVLGYLLDSKTQREMTEAVKQYNNRKGIELTLDVRF